MSVDKFSDSSRKIGGCNVFISKIIIVIVVDPKEIPLLIENQFGFVIKLHLVIVVIFNFSFPDRVIRIVGCYIIKYGLWQSSGINMIIRW